MFVNAVFYCIIYIPVHVICYITDEETVKFKTATRKFMKLFNMPNEEKLVNCKFSCGT
jgi:hypothetical protein